MDAALKYSSLVLCLGAVSTWPDSLNWVHQNRTESSCRMRA